MDPFVFSLALKACTLSSTLLDMYIKTGKFTKAVKFDEMPTRNVTSWTAIITGLARAGFNSEGIWKQLADYNVHYVKSAPLDERQLFSFLQEKYEPVFAKWTIERCVICRWDEDYDFNKIIICNRFQLVVHQECYGVRDVHDFTSWVCRALKHLKLKENVVNVNMPYHHLKLLGLFLVFFLFGCFVDHYSWNFIKWCFRIGDLLWFATDCAEIEWGRSQLARIKSMVK
ncbi:hypothetical protein L2E82_39049 [Cichorium intybus]|uniref:Uncharacterized protein n=1 Tax=Cichorium intybus TaxID=13427 RepID=A0ACB9AGD6_CICIN|nr:hypothetical protein L2E82_39049 [Cichorium intybus]